MISVSVNPESTTTFKAETPGRLNAVAVAIPKSDALTATPATFYDSSVTENTNAITWNEYEIQTDLESSATVQNISTTQTLTDGIVAPVGIGGEGRIKVTDGPVSKILKTDTRKTAGNSYREFVAYSNGTVGKYLYDQISPLLDATPDVSYYSAYNHTSATYTRNALCWAESIDLSCVAVGVNSGGGWTRQRGGTLITARHILVAKHYALAVGSQVRFSNAAGTVETVSVTGTASAYDLLVCTLSAAVTVATPCAIAGTWITQGRTDSANYARWYSGGLAIYANQDGDVHVASVGSTTALVGAYSGPLTINGTVFQDCENIGFADHSSSSAVPAEYAAMRSMPISGDSGQPCFVVVDGEPVLLWTWTTANGGTPAYIQDGAVLNALIAAADVNAGVSTGLTVSVAANPIT